MPIKGLDGLLRTSLDLELDLQVSRTRQARLDQELHVLRELKAQLEKARQQGQRELPAWVREDERFRLLLKQAEKQVSWTSSTRPGVFEGGWRRKRLLTFPRLLLRPTRSSCRRSGWRRC